VEHLTTTQLEAGLDDVRDSPDDEGLVELIVRRPAENERELVTEAVLSDTQGLAGDTWRLRAERRTTDISTEADKQITVMNSRAAALVARDRERRALAGDQLYVDLDLSIDNLPVGSQLQVGSAVLEISAHPHLGCAKFASRFGEDALRLVNSPTGRQLRLRGLNARVVTGGVVRVGDKAHKLLG
jgi:MOSC domain-containing protein YiiM